MTQRTIHRDHQLRQLERRQRMEDAERILWWGLILGLIGAAFFGL